MDAHVCESWPLKGLTIGYDAYSYKIFAVWEFKSVNTNQSVLLQILLYLAVNFMQPSKKSFFYFPNGLTLCCAVIMWRKSSMNPMMKHPKKFEKELQKSSWLRKPVNQPHLDILTHSVSWIYYYVPYMAICRAQDIYVLWVVIRCTSKFHK